MSLLSTKSWNPRSYKNREKVSKAEAAQAQLEHEKLQRKQANESEFRYERMKNKLSENEKPRVEESTEEKQDEASNDVTSWLRSNNSSSVSSPKPTKPIVDNALKREPKPWYSFEEYDIPMTPSKSKSNDRDDPLHIMNATSSSAPSHISSRKHHHRRDYKANDHRTNLLGKRPDEISSQKSPPISTQESPSSSESLISKLREERLKRERIEREKAAKLTSPTSQQTRSYSKPSESRPSLGRVRGDY